MTAECDVLVIGAGIVGAACARALARDGARVTVMDARSPGSGATAAGMGHLVVMDDSPAQFALNRYSQQQWAELRPQLPAAAEYESCGTIWVAADDEEMAEVHRKHAFYAEHGVRSQILDAGELARAEPNLRKGLAGGLRVPGDAVIYPPVAAQWLLDEALRQGAAWQRGTVRRLEGTRVGWEAIAGQQPQHIAAKQVVNAAGCAAPSLTPGLEIRPRKGHLAITDRYPGFVRHQLIELGYLKSAHGSDEDSVAFNVQPRATGQLLIGSSRQFDVTRPEVEARMVQRMLARALEYLPGLAGLSVIRTWTGFRAATPDSLPLVGPHPSQPGLLLACGHEGLGITTSLGTAELIAAHVAGRTPAIAAEPYLPERLTRSPAHV